MNNAECEHKWEFQSSDYIKNKDGYYTDEYKRVDTYYCEKCLAIKENINKREIRNINEGKPEWWR